MLRLMTQTQLLLIAKEGIYCTVLIVFHQTLEIQVGLCYNPTVDNETNLANSNAAFLWQFLFGGLFTELASQGKMYDLQDNGR